MPYYKSPKLFRVLFPTLLWKVPTEKKVIYLTFDDGPIPEITPWVLSQLSLFNAKATFFVIGDNVRKHPEIFKQLLLEGHAVGNHTFNHLNGWDTENATYYSNIAQCQEEMNKHLLPNGVERQLFRPPYVKLKPAQMRALKSTYKIVMWDVISYDFDAKLSPDECLEQSIANTEPGSIIIFHDSIKAFPRLKEVLPAYLAHFSAQGYKFEVLPE